MRMAGLLWLRVLAGTPSAVLRGPGVRAVSALALALAIGWWWVGRGEPELHESAVQPPPELAAATRERHDVFLGFARSETWRSRSEPLPALRRRRVDLWSQVPRSRAGAERPAPAGLRGQPRLPAPGHERWSAAAKPLPSVPLPSLVTPDFADGWYRLVEPALQTDAARLSERLPEPASDRTPLAVSAPPARAGGSATARPQTAPAGVAMPAPTPSFVGAPTGLAGSPAPAAELPPGLVRSPARAGDAPAVFPGPQLARVEPIAAPAAAARSQHADPSEAAALPADLVRVDGMREIEELAGRFRDVPGLQIAAEGRLGGSGRVVGDVLNAGTLSPGHSPGYLEIAGDLLQAAGGVLEIELAGTSPDAFDRVVVEGLAQLRGTIAVRLIDAFAPILGDSFDILSASEIDVEQADFVLPVLAQGLALLPVTLSFGPSEVLRLETIRSASASSSLILTPEPSAAALLALGLLALAARRRR